LAKAKSPRTRPGRLNGEEISRYLAECPHEFCDLVLALRDVVLRTAPAVHEEIKFNALCYFKPNCRYGAIGGNVCLIDYRKGHVELGFIHGSSLPDPKGLLQGSGKAKRHIEIRSLSCTRLASIRALIHAAVAYTPKGAEERGGSGGR
jgi:hypothetical protein